MSRDSRQRLQPDDFTVGWVCAIAEELAAARLLLDARYDDVGYESQGYLYTFGKIGKHNVAIGYLPAGRQGSSSATEVAMDMKAHFKRMRFCLMVGIGGGVPSAHNDIRLGDVVVSQPAGQHGGVVQYDFGKRERGVFRRTGSLNAPPTLLLNALSRVESSRMIGESKFRDYLSAFESHPEFNRAGAGPDILFRAGYEHVGGTDCSGCDQSTIFRRRPPTKEVEVHFGTIASGNQVMKTASVRDKISADLGGVLCFEMEAAGLMNSFQCLVIRGISDYADSHKNDKWKKPAAAAAAAFAKDLLSELSTQEVSGTSTLDEAVRELVP
ncbi:nucleoside phosphorylase domain-containing protein [Aspergillus californicus]